jgi:hypothetical protein
LRTSNLLLVQVYDAAMHTASLIAVKVVGAVSLENDWKTSSNIERRHAYPALHTSWRLELRAKPLPPVIAHGTTAFQRMTNMAGTCEIWHAADGPSPAAH